MCVLLLLGSTADSRSAARPVPVSRTRVVSEQDKPAVLAPHAYIVAAAPAVSSSDDGGKDDGGRGKGALASETRPAVPV